MALIVPAQMIGVEQLLFYLIGANMNTGAVQPFKFGSRDAAGRAGDG